MMDGDTSLGVARVCSWVLVLLEARFPRQFCRYVSFDVACLFAFYLGLVSLGFYLLIFQSIIIEDFATCIPLSMVNDQHI